MILTDFGDIIAERMRAEHRSLAERWFGRLLDLLPVGAREIFPTESLLDHVPDLILEISGYLRAPEERAIAANTAIMEKAGELGALRYAQQASLHQVLREYQILSGVLVSFVLEELERLGVTPPPAETILLASRLHQAVDALSQSTVEAFVTLYTRTIAEQQERLEEFTRMAAHEWRQPLGALQFAVGLLTQTTDPELSKRAMVALDRNVKHLVSLTHKLESVARVHNTPADNPLIQEVSSATIVDEAARQLRDMAETHGVEVRILPDTLPTLTVDVGRLELVFINLISNAIKYADPAKAARYVEIRGRCDTPGWCEFVVSDNGIGIPSEALQRVFQKFTRAHAQRDGFTHVSGIGLGLSIVDDCVRALGGSVHVESAEGAGTTFLIKVPAKPDAGMPQ